jgi:hypothetical protein
MLRSLTLILCALLLSSCCLLNTDRSKNDLSNHIALQRSFWQAKIDNQKPLEDRLLPAPDELIDYITQDNIKQGWPNRPKKAQLNPELLKAYKKAYLELPEELRRYLDSKVIGVFFLRDLGGTGYTEIIFDKDKKPSAAVVVFDLDMINVPANVWATRKEETAFEYNRYDYLEMRIEDDLNNTSANAFQFILLHELGHVVSIWLQPHPPFYGPKEKKKNVEEYPFSKISWKTAKNGKAVIKDKNLTELSKQSKRSLSFYQPENKRVSRVLCSPVL